MRHYITNSNSAACQYACGVICRRFEAFSGDAAVLDGAGRHFEEMAAGRAATAA
jgi:hypothetical protein